MINHVLCGAPQSRKGVRLKALCPQGKFKTHIEVERNYLHNPISNFVGT